jgi:N-methyl-L-proline demethylase
MSTYSAVTDPLFQPYQLKHLTLKNRLMSTSHEPNYSEDGLPGERYRLYHVEKAKGGIALTMTAGSAIVSQDSPPSFGNLHAYRDEIVPALRDLTDQCHELGTAVMIQITHLGRRTGWNYGDWLPVVAPSPIREPAHRSFPKAIEDWDIERIVADYASAAERMKAAGLDGIEIEAYGHLLDGFWSPATNRRDDEYGGSLDNRLRFTFRVLDAMRDSVGPDFIIGFRLALDEAWDEGFDVGTGLEIARRLTATGQIDFLNVIRGHIDTDASLTGVIPVQGMASAPHLDFSGEIRAETNFPVFHAAKIDDIATARHAIASGKLDMVGMTRAHIADPHIASKTRAGRETEIRPCVGATYCLDRIYEGRDTACIHNAATGREASMPQIVTKSSGAKKRVTIIGAGPGGLEAARVSAERGHEVIVLEASDRAGGQINLITRLPRRSAMAGIVDWRLAECARLGVEFRYNVFAEENDVLETRPDIVVVATGGLPNTNILAHGSEHVVSTWDILSGDVKPGETVLLYDDNGAHPGMQTAEMITRAGSDLEIITPERFFAPEIGGLNHVHYARAFQECGTRITINTRVRSVDRDGNKLRVALSSDYGDVLNAERLVDQIVVEHGTLPMDDLYFELKDSSINRGAVDYRALIKGGAQESVANSNGHFRLYRIGDAVSSRNIHAAIYDALRLCKDF